MKTFTHRVVPQTGIDELILTPGMREKMDAIITFEKARAVLLGQWGFQQERLGTACLFWGPHGTGKSSAAEVGLHFPSIFTFLTIVPKLSRLFSESLSLLDGLEAWF
jgi:hypothetical protein